jgi:hypothetical protein
MAGASGALVVATAIAVEMVALRARADGPPSCEMLFDDLVGGSEQLRWHR